MAHWGTWLAGLGVIVMAAGDALARTPCPGGAGAVATGVVVEGGVTVTPARGATFTIAPGARLCPGDAIAVAEGARLELQFTARETTVGLAGNTVVRLPAPAPEGARPDLELQSGLMRFISSVRDYFSIATRYANAGIDGTEAVIAADRGAPGMLTLMEEGALTLTRPAAEALALAGGQAGYAGPEGGLARATPETVPGPYRAFLLAPESASDWAVYYPPVLLAAGTDSPAIDRALARLESGDPDAAEALLARGPVRSGDRAAALALRAVIAVLRNRLEEGAELADRAVALDPALGAAHVARSYALQATGAVAEARAAAALAVERTPRDAFAWARLAELHMTVGARRAALAASETALGLAETPLAHAVRGFALLAARDRIAAEAAFARAARLDGEAPLPRLGRGLVLIRSGRIAAGRRMLELATALDPRRASLRTWLGRAYLAEGRGDKAAAEFDLAKARDPDDPTPWLFSAAEKFAANRPVEALGEIEAARRRGPGRSVLRSEQGLAEDRAARSAALGRVLDTLGFTGQARIEGTRAVEQDPTDPGAHRLLADLYGGDPGLVFAQTSSLLRGTLLSPPSLDPILPALSESDLALLEASGPARATFAEYSPFFAPDGAALQMTGSGGTQTTLADTVSVNAKYGAVAIGFGQSHFQTQGVRANNDVFHNLVSLQLKGEVTPDVTLFGEYRFRKTDAGDRSLEFDLDDGNPTLDTEDERNLVRLGVHAELGPNHDLLGVVDWRDQQSEIAFASLGLRNRTSVEASGVGVQGQYIARFGPLTTTVGVAYGGLEEARDIEVTLPTPFGVFPIFSQRSDGRQDHLTGYAYASYHFDSPGPFAGVTLTGGVSVDHFEDSARGGAEITEVNPKLGIRTALTPELELRAAYTGTVTPNVLHDERLEPASVAGAAQYRPERAGAVVDQIALGAEYRIAPGVTIGAEWAERWIESPVANAPFAESEERAIRGYLNAVAGQRWSGSLKVERVKEESAIPGDLARFEMTRLAGDLRYFHPSGAFAAAGLDYVWHEAVIAGTPREDRFPLASFSLGYRLPDERGVVSVEVRNALDRDFGFQDRALRALGANAPTDPLFARELTVFASATLRF